LGRGTAKALSKLSMGLDGDGYLNAHSIPSFRAGCAENEQRLQITGATVNFLIGLLYQQPRALSLFLGSLGFRMVGNPL
jgi:hypothetical protein